LETRRRLLIFNDIKVVGFWMTRWNSEQTREVRETMLEEVGELIRSGSLNLHYETRTLIDHEAAFEAAQQGFIGKKQIFLFS
jgi:trans-2-enoyl-CoA reductase